MVGDEVLHILHARLQQNGLAVAVVGVNGIHFRGHGAAKSAENVAFALGLVELQEEALILLVVDDLIVGNVLVQTVPVQLVWALGRVERSVIEGTIVVAPFQPVICVLDPVRQQVAACQVLDSQRVGLRTIGIEGESQEGMIGADRKVTHAQVLEPFGLYVEIDQHLLVRVQTTLLAAVDTILLALLFAVVVEVAAVGNRYRFICLLDTAFHLVIEGALQCLCVGQHCFGIFIFGFQIGQYGRVVALSQPVVVIDACVAVIPMLNGMYRRHRRRQVRLWARQSRGHVSLI